MGLILSIAFSFAAWGEVRPRLVLVDEERAQFILLEAEDDVWAAMSRGDNRFDRRQLDRDLNIYAGSREEMRPRAVATVNIENNNFKMECWIITFRSGGQVFYYPKVGFGLYFRDDLDEAFASTTAINKRVPRYRPVDFEPGDVDTLLSVRRHLASARTLREVCDGALRGGGVDQ